MTKRLPKVAIGLSGGVDSSLSAHLLVEQGYDVTGVYLECWRAPGCRTEEDRKDALQVALNLNIPFKVLDFKQTYKDKVVEYFFDEYQAGRTPNPDILCNSEIKFGLFYDWAMENGFDYVATGHYGKIMNYELKIKNNLPLTPSPFTLAIPKDKHKDQTYFLYRLKEEQLSHILFPLADLNKTEVRREAKKRNIHVANKKDSVGICFIGDINVHDFLFERLGENPGEVIDADGHVIGQHKGLWFYTVGQRHGFEIDKRTLVKQSDGTELIKENLPPFYVIKKLPKTNQLMVGFGPKTYSNQFEISNIHWFGQNLQSSIFNLPLFVRIRHTGSLIPCRLTKNMVTLGQPTQGIAAGQSAVFYAKAGNEYLVLGGSIIE